MSSLCRRIRSLLHLGVEAHGQCVKFLLDIADNLTLCSGRKDLHYVPNDITAGKVKAKLVSLLFVGGSARPPFIKMSKFTAMYASVSP